MQFSQEQVTVLLRRWQAGEQVAFQAILPDLYDSLRQQAAALYAGNPSPTLQPTALVHEAWMRLMNQQTPWQNRAHFFAVAAVIMRRILVDSARARLADKRGGAYVHTEFDEALAVMESRGIDMLALDRALELLEDIDTVQARIVELRFFGGLTQEETAEILEVSPKTVQRGWNLARAWLQRYLQPGTS